MSPGDGDEPELRFVIHLSDSDDSDASEEDAEEENTSGDENTTVVEKSVLGSDTEDQVNTSSSVDETSPSGSSVQLERQFTNRMSLLRPSSPQDSIVGHIRRNSRDQDSGGSQAQDVQSMLRELAQ